MEKEERTTKLLRVSGDDADQFFSRFDLVNAEAILLYW